MFLLRQLVSLDLTLCKSLVGLLILRDDKVEVFVAFDWLLMLDEGLTTRVKILFEGFRVEVFECINLVVKVLYLIVCLFRKLTRVRIVIFWTIDVIEHLRNYLYLAYQNFLVVDQKRACTSVPPPRQRLAALDLHFL